MQRVAIWAWHVPYISMLAKALPEVEWLVLPTRYNLSGWDERQRLKPENVTPVSTWAEADAAIAQTPDDLADLLIAPDDFPAVYLAHNHWALDQTPPERIATLCRRLVCISEMKARSWRDYGNYDDEIDVLPPGIDPAEYEHSQWRGKGGYILTVANVLRRPLFDGTAWQRATGGKWTRLIGIGNEGIPGAIGPAPSWDALRSEYEWCDHYLNPTCPPYEDTYNLAALEAAACGVPVRNLHGTPPRVEDFPIDAFRERWRRILSEVTG